MIFALRSHGIIWGLYISNHMRKLPSLRQSLNNKAMQPYLTAFAWRQNNKKPTHQQKEKMCEKRIRKMDSAEFNSKPLRGEKMQRSKTVSNVLANLQPRVV